MPTRPKPGLTAVSVSPLWGKAPIAIALVCLLALVLHKCSVSNAVDADRKAAKAEAAEKALGAERGANRADATRQSKIQANAADLRKAMDDAEDKNPDAARAPAGPVVNAAVDRLRERATGNQPAAR